MNQTDITVIEEFVSYGGQLEHGSLRSVLQFMGFVNDKGVIVEYDRLQRMLALAAAPKEEQAAALQLPADNPLRRFYEHSLAAQPETARQIIEVVRRQIEKKSGPLRRATPSVPANAGLGSQLFGRFQQQDYFNGALKSPSYRLQPERIVWSLHQSFDLGANLVAELGEADRRKHSAYELLARGTPDAEEKILKLGIAVTSIPAMRAWVTRTGCPPPVMAGIFQLHTGKSRLRANLFCSAKSKLLPAFTERFRQVAEHCGVNSLTIEGPLPGREVKETFSAARIFNLPETVGDAEMNQAIRFTVETWEMIQRVVVACNTK